MTPTNLDIFRTVYTFNTKNEKLSNGDSVKSGKMGKILMLIPIIAQIIAPILLFVLITTASQRSKKENAAYVFRITISFFATPLLLVIDLAGTAVKSCLDARAKKQQEVLLPNEA